jgi:hypothetical protein
MGAMVKTVAIIDFAHCGTTMMAGIYEILGVPMVADDYHQMKWEDHEIILPAKAGDDGLLAAVVASRNAQYDTWGFKFPGMLRVSPWLAPLLADPVYIAIYKDLVSVTRRRFGTSNRQLYRKMLNTAKQMQSSMQSIASSGLEVHLFSYCKAIVDPVGFVLSLASVAELEPQNECIDRAADYVQANRHGPRRSYPLVKDYL